MSSLFVNDKLVGFNFLYFFLKTKYKLKYK